MSGWVKFTLIVAVVNLVAATINILIGDLRGVTIHLVLLVANLLTLLFFLEADT